MRSSIKILLCFLAIGLSLYQLVEEQNQLASLRVALPALEQEVRLLQADILSMQNLLGSTQTPAKLLQWATQPQYAHLTFPYETEILHISLNPSPTP